ncbi:hypothetical protein [Olsenella urininfantis]|uniref:hypothetical protein n=1 Tax=Olsenella urininfantis TaxID=1871033 RepID=UPI0013562B6E|nr:hypothetical protein [Olsenella urininfantis]
MAANEIQPSSDKSRRLVAERSPENVEPGKLADAAERINVLHNRPTQIANDGINSAVRAERGFLTILDPLGDL